MDIAGNGEYFWHRERAGDAISWLASYELAIIGGEAYLRHAVAWASYLGHWETTPGHAHDEPWQSFVARGKAQALEAIDAGAERWELSSGDLPGLLYFFAVAAPPGEAASSRD
jgi:hypothetical protein